MGGADEAPPTLAVQEMFRFERLQRGPHRGARNPHLTAQLLLGGKLVARRENARRQRLPQIVDHPGPGREGNGLFSGFHDLSRMIVL